VISTLGQSVCEVIKEDALQGDVTCDNVEQVLPRIEHVLSFCPVLTHASYPKVRFTSNASLYLGESSVISGERILITMPSEFG